jgi:hypothetical protein
MVRFCPSMLAAVVALFVPALSHAASDTTFQRTLNVTGAPVVVVQTGSGDIRVSQGAPNQVAILGKVHFSRWKRDGAEEKDLQQFLQAPPIQQTGNTIDVGEGDDSSPLLQKYLSHGHGISIDYEITVPQGTNLNIKSGSGNLRVEGTNGPVRARTGSGGIVAHDIEMNSRLATGAGSIHVRHASGTLRLEASSGDIYVKGSSLSDLQVGTGSGNIQIDSVQGHLRAEAGSGDITVKGTPLTHWQLETDSGNIDVTIPISAKFRLDARSDSGSIKTDLPLDRLGEQSKRHIYGTLNGGGPTVRVEAVSGDIVVH